MPKKIYSTDDDDHHDHNDDDSDDDDKKVGVLVLQAGWLPKGKIGGVPASDTPREMNR